MQHQELLGPHDQENQHPEVGASTISLTLISQLPREEVPQIPNAQKCLGPDPPFLRHINILIQLWDFIIGTSVYHWVCSFPEPQHTTAQL